MTGKILKMKPIFQEKIWGGNRLHTIFNYDVPSDTTGECWAISGQAVGSRLAFEKKTIKKHRIRGAF